MISGRFMLAAMCLSLSGCSLFASENIIAWPGMSAAQFNEYNNSTSARLRTNEGDWIGINSPTTLEFRYGDRSTSFFMDTLGGGIMVRSTGGEEFGFDPRVTSINFDIGDTYEPIADILPLLKQKCRELEAMAAPTRLEGDYITITPAIISETLETQTDTIREMTLCYGEGAEIAYVITVGHYPERTGTGGDFSQVFSTGNVGMSQAAFEKLAPLPEPE